MTSPLSSISNASSSSLGKRQCSVNSRFLSCIVSVGERLVNILFLL